MTTDDLTDYGVIAENTSGLILRSVYHPETHERVDLHEDTRAGRAYIQLYRPGTGGAQGWVLAGKPGTHELGAARELLAGFARNGYLPRAGCTPADADQAAAAPPKPPAYELD